MSTLKRLLKSLHSAVFDKSADKAVVFYVRHDLEVTWSVDSSVLSVSAGSLQKSYRLGEMTVGQLAGQLVLDGFEVAGLSGEMSGLSAEVLLDSSGGTAINNGDRVYGFRDAMYSLLGSYSKELGTVKYQIGEAIRQMVITQAEGEWLDLWGAIYNTPRPIDLDDQSYQRLIPEEAFRLRVNSYAIEQAILDLTGLDVDIDEPWGYIFRLDESQLSGTHKFYDGSNIGYHLIRPISKEPIDWSLVMPIVLRNRAAGVLVLDPETRLSNAVDASIDGTVWFGAKSMRGIFVQFFSDNRLDYLVLSGEVITRNWPIMISSVITIGNLDPLLDPDPISFKRSIAMASITLSDGMALGDINAVLSRAEITQDGGKLHTSNDLELSSVEQAQSWRPVDLIISQDNPRGELLAPYAVSAGATKWDIRGSYADASISGDSAYTIETSSFLSAKFITPVAVIASKSSGYTGFTWMDDDQWGEYQWELTVEEISALEFACLRIDYYVEYIMSEDLN